MAGLLAWLVPGLGHLYAGHRTRGLVCLVTITVTFWTGVAIGGVQSTVDPKERKLWFLAQLCTGGHAGVAYALHRTVGSGPASRASSAAPAGAWVSTDVGIHYTGVAGLLNLLIILDALSRAELPAAPRGKRRVPLRGDP